MSRRLPCSQFPIEDPLGLCRVRCHHWRSSLAGGRMLAPMMSPPVCTVWSVRCLREINLACCCGTIRCWRCGKGPWRRRGGNDKREGRRVFLLLSSYRRPPPPSSGRVRTSACHDDQIGLDTVACQQRPLWCSTTHYSIHGMVNMTREENTSALNCSVLGRRPKSNNQAGCQTAQQNDTCNDNP